MRLPWLPLPAHHLRNRPKVPLKHGVTPTFRLRQRQYLLSKRGAQNEQRSEAS